MSMFMRKSLVKASRFAPDELRVSSHSIVNAMQKSGRPCRGVLK